MVLFLSPEMRDETWCGVFVGFIFGLGVARGIDVKAQSEGMSFLSDVCREWPSMASPIQQMMYQEMSGCVRRGTPLFLLGFEGGIELARHWRAADCPRDLRSII